VKWGNKLQVLLPTLNLLNPAL